jgi:hypothetical protein
MRRAALASIAVAVAVMASGCLGGGGGSSSSSAGGPSPAQFTAKAEAICRSYKQQIAKLPTPSDLKKLADSGEKAVELQRQEVAELRKLTPPSSQAADIKQMLDAVDQGISKADELIAAARRNDAKAVADAAQALQTALAPANQIARRLHLGECAITP